MSESNEKPLSVQERRGIYEQLSKSSSNLGPQSSKKPDEAQHLVVSGLKEMILKEKQKTLQLEQDLKKIKSENEKLRQNQGSTQSTENKPSPQVTPTTGDASSLKKNLTLSRTECPNHPQRLAVFISKSGKAGCFSCASSDIGIESSEVAAIEKSIKEEEESKLYLQFSVDLLNLSAPKSAPKALLTSSQIHSRTVQPQVTLSANPDLSKGIADVDSQLNNLNQQADLFAYNILLNKKMEMENRQRGFAPVKQTSDDTFLALKPSSQSAATLGQNLSQITQEVNQFDLSQPDKVDLFQYNVKLNKKIGLEAEAKLSGVKVEQSAPRTASQPPKTKPGYKTVTMKSVLGTQEILVKEVNSICQTRPSLGKAGSSKLIVNANDLPLAAYAIVLLARAGSQVQVEQGSKTQLIVGNSSLNGSASIARYAARRYDMNLYSSDAGVATDIDTFVDLAIDLKKKQKSLDKLQTCLKSKKSKFLVGENLTLADLIVWDALRSLELQNKGFNLPSEVSTWYKSVQSTPQLEEAVKILTSRPSVGSLSSSGVVVSSADKEAYINRVMKDFSISRQEAEGMWTKYMGPLLPASSVQDAGSNSIEKRQLQVLQSVSDLENRVFALLKKVDPKHLSPKDRVAVLQYSNLQRLEKLTQRMDKLDGGNAVDRIAQKQEQVLQSLRALEKSTRWIEELDVFQVKKLQQENLANLKALDQRISKLEGNGCVVCGSEVSAKDKELFSPIKTPVCSTCYQSGKFVTASNKIASVETKSIKSKEKQKVSIPNVTEKDDSLVHYFVALSGIPQAESEEREVLVEKIIKVKENVISQGHPEPKPVYVQGSVAMPSKLVTQSFVPVDNSKSQEEELAKALEKEDSQVLYYMALNSLIPSVGKVEQSKEQSKEKSKESKESKESKDESNQDLEKLDSNTLYYMALNGLQSSKTQASSSNQNMDLEKLDSTTLYYLTLNGLCDSPSSAPVSSGTPVDQVKAILTAEFNKYKEPAVSSSLLNPSTPEQQQFIEKWLRLYNSGSRDEIDSFVSQADQFAAFGPIAYALKNLLFAKTFPRSEQKS